jgi:hypothetical protein
MGQAILNFCGTWSGRVGEERSTIPHAPKVPFGQGKGEQRSRRNSGERFEIEWVECITKALSSTTHSQAMSWVTRATETLVSLYGTLNDECRE